MQDLLSRVSRLTPYKVNEIKWHRLFEPDALGYRVDYWVAPLGADTAAGRADFLVKWEPNCYCHFHRHTGATTVQVLEGEHHVVEESASETVHKTRRPGHIAKNPPGDLHMEYGGPEGSTLFFSMQTDDGILFEFVDRNSGAILREVTVDDFANSHF